MILVIPVIPKITDLSYVIQTYGNKDLGYPADVVLQRVQDSLAENVLENLLLSEHKSVVQPLFHVPGETKGHFVPVLAEYVPYLQAMLQLRYAKAYTYAEGKERLERIGYKVSSQGQMNNIFNRMETKLGLKDKRLTAKRIADKNRANKAKGIKRGGQTALQKKSTANARSVKEAKARVKNLEKESIIAKKALAKQAAKSGKTVNEVLGKPLGHRAKKKISIVDQLPEDMRGREILYAPHPKPNG